MKVLCIIPARGGSKGVPGKNICPIAGKPLIQYTIEAALDSKRLKTVYISSDDEKILSFSRNFNGMLIHKRNPAIAKDQSPIADTIEALIDENKLSDEFDAIMLLQPTSPIRTGVQIDEAIILLEQNPTANSVISVVAMNDVHPARMYWKGEKNALKPILSAYEQTRRQDIPTAYYRNGSIYLVRTSAFLKERSVMVKPSFGYEMPSSQLLNIDEPRDLIIAEALIKAWHTGSI